MNIIEIFILDIPSPLALMLVSFQDPDFVGGGAGFLGH